jgi:signal transduction histidine kinase
MSDASPLDGAPIAALAARGGVVTYANDALAALTGLRRDELVGRPWLELFAAEDAERVSACAAGAGRGGRCEGRLSAAAGGRAVQVHAAARGGDVVVQLLDASEAALEADRSAREPSRREGGLEALNRIAEEAATAGDLASFLERGAADAAAAVGAATASVFLVDRERREARLLFAHGHRDEAKRELMRLPLDGTPTGEVAVDGIARVRHVEDVPEPDRSAILRSGLATVAGVPLRYRSSVLGVLSVGFPDRREAPGCGLDLLQAMATHFAAAIETHRLLGDLRGRVAELTLLNDLAVASATLDPVLLVENALRRVTSTFGADVGCAYLAGGGDLRQVASIGLPPEQAGATSRGAPGRAVAGAAFEERKALQFPGDALGSEASALAQCTGVRWVGVVPLLAKERAVGALVLARRQEAFRDDELSLLSAVGVQLGVAVENARLFADTRRRVGDLEAVNALALRVFGSAPGDAASLLGAACEQIARALSAPSAVVLQLDASRERLSAVAAFGATPPLERIAIPVAQSELAARALRTQEPAFGVHVVEDGAGATRVALLLVPLTARGATRGLVAVGDAPDRRFSDAEVALAYALASEAAIGLENAELYAEARRRAEELAMILEGGRALVATLELDEVLDAGVRNLARIVDAPVAALCLADSAQGTLVVRAQAGPHPEIVGTALRGPSLAREAFEQRRPVVVEDAQRDPNANPRLTALTRTGGMLALPLLVRDRSIGAVVIVESRGPRRFSPSEVERAYAIANQLAVAVEHARLYEDLRRSYADLARAQDQLVHRERLAALGELAAIVAHEVRNPLGVIFNSLGSLRRMVQPSGNAKMLLGIVGEEAERLNRIVGDLLDFARPSPPALRPEPLDRVIDDALGAALARGAGRVAVAREIAPDLPAVPMDVRLVRQALLNLTLNAVQAMPGGGTLSVRARLDGAAARVEIADTGPGIADEVRHRIFEPFFTTKATGSGLGLAVVKRIVDDHRGALEVRSAPGEGTTFVLRLPLEAPTPVERVGRAE